MKGTSIVVSYRDPHGQFGAVAQLLLKILSGLQSVSNVPAVGDGPRVLSDSIGLWPEHDSGDSALLALYLARSSSEAECREWADVQRKRGSSGYLVLVLDWLGEPAVVSPSVAVPPSIPWTGLAGALWRRARQPETAAGSPPVTAEHTVSLHAVPDGPNRDRPSFKKREAKALAAAVELELASGFRQRIAAGGAGLVQLYGMVSMWAAALNELDQRESAALASIVPVKLRCRNCGLYVLQQSSESEAASCFYHAGKFSGRGRYAIPRWTCCNSSEERAAPCRSGVLHELEPVVADAHKSLRSSSVMPLPEHSFRPAMLNAAGRILEASSYGAPGRQQLLAQQCQLLAKMKDGARMARRVLRFVQLAMRSRSPLLAPLEFAAWAYRVCSEAAKLAKPAVPPRLLQVMRFNLVLVGTATSVDEESCSQLVLQHRLLASVFRDKSLFVAALRRLAAKEQSSWSRQGMSRHEAAVAVQLGLVLFSQGVFEEAYSLIRGVHLQFEKWPAILGRCLQVMNACETRLGLSAVSTTLQHCALDGDAVRRLLQLAYSSHLPIVKPLEPHFVVNVTADAEGVVHVEAVCSWPVKVQPDEVAVELQSGEGSRIVVRCRKESDGEEENLPTRVSLGSVWHVRKIVCSIGSLQLVRLAEEGESRVRLCRVPPSHKPLLPADHCRVTVRVLHTPLLGLPLVLAFDVGDENMSQVSVWATCDRRSLIDPAVVVLRESFGRVVLPVQGLGLGKQTVELILACRASAESVARPAFVELSNLHVERPVLHRVCVVWANSVWYVGVELVCHAEIVVRKVILDQVHVVACGSTERRFWFAVAPHGGGASLNVGQLFVNVEYVYGEDVVFASRLHLDHQVAASEELPWLLPSALVGNVTNVSVHGNGLTEETLVTLLSSLKYRSSSVLALLDLGRNDLSVSPMIVSALASLVTAAGELRVLRLWDTRLAAHHVEAVATAVRQLNVMREIDLGKNSLGSDAFGVLGAFLASDPALHTLGLWYNQGGDVGTRILMKGLSSNYSLHTLDLRDNGITDAGVVAVVDVLRRNLVLVSLKLQDNDLGEDGILSLSQVMHDNYVLESLEIVDDFATLIVALPYLERISFGVKRNRSFSEQRGNRSFVGSNVGLSKVPPQLFSLSMLQALDLSHNRFTVFPESLTVLRSLQRLSLAHNGTLQFPAHCCSAFAQLHALDMSFNRLATFPAEVAVMTALRVLHLDNNALEMLPVALGRVSSWESLKVEGNPLSCIPASIVAKGSRTVFYHLKDLVSGGGDYCYRVKLLVTGQANVGKTSLLSALKNDVGSVNKMLRLLTGKGRRSSTLGISLEDWKPSNSLITFSTWDFGGQLVYYATHQFFLSKRSLYLLVFSLAQKLQHNRLLSWLNSIQSRAPGVSVMLIGTHLDDKRRVTTQHIADVSAAIRRTLTNWERLFAPNERLKIIKQSDEQWFYPLSAMTGEGVAEVKARLMDVAADQPSLRERVPRIYLQLLDVVRLQRRTENIPITSWDRLREWAGFDDEAQLERAVQLLHDWGELLWFSESATLRSVVVLSPQWLTRMFATIISPSVPEDDDPGGDRFSGGSNSSLVEMELSSRSPHSSATEESTDVEMLPSAGAILSNSPGIIDRSALPSLWHEYDPAHYVYFEKLLETFELWIPIDNGERFIVPVLLPKRDSDTECGMHWEMVRYGRCFWCPFPLHGLFERCIVQLLRLFSPLKYWRNEVLLAGTGSLRVLARMTPFAMTNHPHGERLSFFFAAEPSVPLSELRSAVSATTFIVHNYLMDWYNASLRDQVITEAVCPLCCSASGVGGTFPLESIVKEHIAGKEQAALSLSGPLKATCQVCNAQHLLTDLLVELTDAAVHATGDYGAEMEELRHVADGSCSRVFQCRFGGDKIVAVKKLRVHSLTTTWFLEFLQEISILQLLRHDSIVGIETAFLRPLCIVLEWIGGGTLDQAISRFEGDHDWALLVRVLDDVAQGLHYLHAVPVVHRDLK